MRQKYIWKTNSKYIYNKMEFQSLLSTRTTRTPAFWGYPPPPNDYPYHWVYIGSQVKRRQSQSYKFKKFAKISNFWILKRALHATHLLKLLDKMCTYEMDPMSIVEDTERTRFCPQTDRRTDGQGDTSIPPFQLRWSGGYNKDVSGMSIFLSISLTISCLKEEYWCLVYVCWPLALTWRSSATWLTSSTRAAGTWITQAKKKKVGSLYNTMLFLQNTHKY